MSDRHWVNVDYPPGGGGGWCARCADCGWESPVFTFHASAVDAGRRHANEELEIAKDLRRGAGMVE